MITIVILMIVLVMIFSSCLVIIIIIDYLHWQEGELGLNKETTQHIT